MRGSRRGREWGVREGKWDVREDGRVGCERE